MCPDVYVNKRYRKNQKTLTFAAGGSDQITMSGPFDEIAWSIIGTTDAHTIDGYGIERCLRRVQISSDKRGVLADLSGITMYRLSLAFFNTGYKVDTVGGGSLDGVGGILPFSADADELITFQCEFGSLAEIASTGDLLGFSGVLRTMCGVINDPMAKTYFGFRDQTLGASGVIGVAAIFQQPTVAPIPGMYLTGELFTTETTNLQAVPANTLGEVRITNADDYLIDEFAVNLLLVQGRRVYNAPAAGVFLVRHIPVPATDVFQVTLTNGGVATIQPSRMCYIFVGGQVSGGASKPTVEQPTAHVPTPQGLKPNPIPQLTRPSSPVGSAGYGAGQRTVGTIGRLLGR